MSPSSTSRTTRRISQTDSLSLPRVAIGLGSSLGDRTAYLRFGIAALALLLDNTEVGPLFSSSPERRPDQPEPPPGPGYLNTAVTGYCRATPEQLLAELKLCELRAGRRAAERNAPRPLDLDLLLWDEVTIDRPELTVPHPRLVDRPFVLAPLAALAPDWRVPGTGSTVAALLDGLPESGRIERIEWPDARGSARC